MDRQRSIFISYRREDSAYAAGRLYDRLSPHFGADRIFMDIDTIGLGVDFVQQIDNAVSACDVLLAVIGPRWVGAADKKGNRRLDNPNDFVRLEISTALKRNINVIPVLVDGSSMPELAELPEPLEGLERRNGIEIGHTRFNADAEKLIRGIEQIFSFMQDEPEIPETEPLSLKEIEEDIDVSLEVPITSEPNALANKEDHAETSVAVSPAIVKQDLRLRQFITYTLIGFALTGLLGSFIQIAVGVGTDLGLSYSIISYVIASAISSMFVGIALRKIEQRVDTNQIFIVIGFGVVGGLIAGVISGITTNSMMEGGDINIAIFTASIILATLIDGGMAGFGIGFAIKQVILNLEWGQIWKIAFGWIIANLLGSFLPGLFIPWILASIFSPLDPISTNNMYAIGGVIISLLHGVMVGYIGGRTILSEINKTSVG